MKKIILAVLLVPLFSFAESSQDLLRESDRSRGGVNDGITWDVKINSHDDGKLSTREYVVKAKGQDALVTATGPARNIGEVYLFNDRDMWFFKPSLKKPVALSSRQKLVGQAANGDIATTNYARDYTPTLEKTEVLDGEKTSVLLLKAKSDNLTYDQIRYWVQNRTKLAVKAEFLTLEGKVFKVAAIKYENEIEVGGKKIPFVSEVEISDAKFKENRSTLIYKKPIIKDQPKSLFNINNLTR